MKGATEGRPSPRCQPRTSTLVLQRRGGVVTFEHHRALVKLPDAERQKRMDMVEKKSISVKWLRKSIEPGRVATKSDLAPPPETDSGYGTITPHVNRLTTILTKMEREGEFDEMDAEGLLAVLEDLEPTIVQIVELIRCIEDFENEECIEEMQRLLDRTNLPALVLRRVHASPLGFSVAQIGGNQVRVNTGLGGKKSENVNTMNTMKTIENIKHKRTQWKP